jgi:hypothetical protein
MLGPAALTAGLDRDPIGADWNILEHTGTDWNILERTGTSSELTGICVESHSVIISSCEATNAATIMRGNVWQSI